MGGDRADTVGVEEQVLVMEGLTPGDFAVVGRSWVSLDQLTVLNYLRLLQQERSVKSSIKNRLGFV